MPEVAPDRSPKPVRLARQTGVFGMPWNDEYYPASMRNLAPRVRAKAIEIANALLAEGYDEGMAIRIAIAKAKAWAEHHPGDHGEE